MLFNEFLKRLLTWEDKPFSCRKIKRSAAYKAAFQKWVGAQGYLTWTSKIHKAYHYRKAGMPHACRIQLIEENNRKGCIFFYDPAFCAQTFNFVFDFIKLRVQEQGYRLHSTDLLEIKHERYTEQVEKYLLLPPASDLEGSSLCNQLYGNITLDFTKINKHPGYIRLMANTYADPYFSAPLLFTDLLDHVLQPTEQPRSQSQL